ncbi:MAG: BamA/TamA family outer membrane protein [Candidatus Krumholzibacteriota bacterium]|nr:BamA/TamA family outer membrane protein [Candidatus Krumholzibacteriota bacterium]
MRPALMMLLVLFAAVPAAGGDGPPADDEWIVLPALFYTPETGTGGGPLVLWNIRHGEERRLSSVFATVCYTEKRQTIVQLGPELVSGDGRWRLVGEIGYERYPSTFYGIGPGPGIEEDYAAESANLLLAFQRRISPGLFAGPRLFLHRERVYEAEAGGLVEGGIPGSGTWSAAGAGLLVTRDTRDDRLQPRSGTFAEAGALACGGDAAYRTAMLDLRAYRSPRKRGVIAARCWFGAAGGEVPFQMLPAIGGVSTMRGYPYARFRDRVAWVCQAEYRLHVWWRLGAAVFGGAGSVAGRLGDLAAEDIETAAGVGLRVQLGKEGAQLRIDMGFGHRSSGLYFVINEAY